MTQKTLTFFRVFDIAFFAPGVVLIGLFANMGLKFPGATASLSSPNGVIALLSGIAALYIAGVAAHSAVWYAYRSRWARRWQDAVEDEIQEELEESPSAWPPIALEFEGPTRDELILYFWYLRATCWNIAASLLAVSLILPLGKTGTWSERILLASLSLLAAILLFSQGKNYHITYRRCLRFKRASQEALPLNRNDQNSSHPQSQKDDPDE